MKEANEQFAGVYDLALKRDGHKPKEIKKQVCAEAAKFVKKSRSQTAMPPMTGVSDL